MMHQGNVGNYRLMMPQANPAGCFKAYQAIRCPQGSQTSLREPCRPPCTVGETTEVQIRKSWLMV
jgi:hypothetical protein